MGSIDEATSDGGDGFSNAAAASLLEQTRRRAERELDFRSPLVSAVAAVVALLGFGMVWLSVRGQHPFTGPTPAALAALYLLVAVRLATVAYAHHRATDGVTGRSTKVLRAETGAVVTGLTAVYALMAALVHDGGRQPAFYWVYGVTATLVVLATFWAGRSAALADWPALVLSAAVMLVAAASALAGPRGMWLGDGVGLCVVLLGYSVWQRGRFAPGSPS